MDAHAIDVWEYIVVYVDDIIVAMKDPKSFFEELQDPEKVRFKMKGVGSPTYHLRADFFRDDDGTLCLGSQTYGKRLCSNFEQLYEAPKSVFSPLDHDDHPELDDSPFCGPEDMSKFQSLIGACQWMISLCHIDIAQAIMSLSWFCHCPRQGHVDHLKRVCGYICKLPQGAIRFCVRIPDHESIFGTHPTKYDWMETVYRTPAEDIPSNAPTAKGNPVHTTTYSDANLLHDLVTGRSATGVLHFFNQTPIDSFS